MISYLLRSAVTTAIAIAAASAGCHLIGSLFSMPVAIAYSSAWALLVAVLWGLFAKPRSNP